MYVSARTDYALRAMLVLAAWHPQQATAVALATAQDIPLRFLQGIMLDLRRAGLVRSHRGARRGYGLARPATEITVGSVIRAVDGALSSVRGRAVETTTYQGAAIGLHGVWLTVRDAVESVVDHTTLAGVYRAGGHAPTGAITSQK